MSARPPEVKSFDLESRIREIISESFEPVLRREAEDRENILVLLRSAERHKKQLEDLEMYSKTADRRMLQLDDLNKKLFNSDTERRVSEADVTRRFNEVEGRFENLNMEIDQTQKLLRQLETRNSFLDKELNSIHEIITTHKDSIAKTVRDLLTRVEYNCSDLVRSSSKAEAAARESSLRLAEMLKLGPQLTSQVETMKKTVGECEYEVSKMKRSKLEEKDLLPHRKEWQLEVGKLKEGLHQEEAKRNSIENFLDKYLPMSILASLSESLHASLDHKSLQRLTQYEVAKIPELKNAVAEKKTTLDEMKQYVRESVTKSEIRASQPKFRESSPDKERFSRGSSRSKSSDEDSRTSRTRKRSSRKHYTRMSKPYDEEHSSSEASLSKEKSIDEIVKEPTELQAENSPDASSVRSRPIPSRDSSRGPEITTLEFNFEQLSELTPKSSMSRTLKFTEESPGAYRSSEFDADSEADSSITKHSMKDFPQQGHISRPISEMSEEGLSSTDPSPDLNQFVKGIRPSPIQRENKTQMRRNRKNLTSYGGKPNKEIEFAYEPQFTDKEVAELRGIAQEFELLRSEIMLLFEQKQSSMQDIQLRSFEELQAYIGMMQSEFESATRGHKRDQAEWKSKIANFEMMLNQAGEEVNRRAHEVRNMSQMIACLAEYGLISNSLMLQDETDRESIQLTGYRDVTKTDKQVITMSTECVSCSGQSAGLVAAFKMACLSYNPSQMNYRHRKFTRQQLLHVQSAMLQGCWSELKQRPPFLGADFAPNFDDPITVTTTTAKKKSRLLEPYTPRTKTKPRHVRLNSLNSTQ